MISILHSYMRINWPTKNYMVRVLATILLFILGFFLKKNNKMVATNGSSKVILAQGLVIVKRTSSQKGSF